METGIHWVHVEANPEHKAHPVAQEAHLLFVDGSVNWPGGQLVTQVFAVESK